MKICHISMTIKSKILNPSSPPCFSSLWIWDPVKPFLATHFEKYKRSDELNDQIKKIRLTLKPKNVWEQKWKMIICNICWNFFLYVYTYRCMISQNCIWEALMSSFNGAIRDCLFGDVVYAIATAAIRIYF